MSDTVLPQQKHPKLIVVVAFDRGEDGECFRRSVLLTIRQKNGRSQRHNLLFPDGSLIKWLLHEWGGRRADEVTWLDQIERGLSANDCVARAKIRVGRMGYQAMEDEDDDCTGGRATYRH